MLVIFTILSAKLSKLTGIASKKLRALDSKPFLALGAVLRVRRGSKLSRIFRLLFEHKAVNKVLGTNLALALLAAGALPAVTPQLAQADINLNTRVVNFQTESASRYPVDRVKISQGYWTYHPALDLDGITGDPIYPVKAGIVQSVEYSRVGYGNNIVINHGSEISTLYAHLSEISVSIGQVVDKNTVIGKMGATGRAFGDHLHFEVRDNATGRAINPFSILPR